MKDHLNLECLFADKSVTYEQFIDELATRLAVKIQQVENGEMEISKNKAYKMYGRAEVDRWIKSGKLKPSRVTPGMTKYKVGDLDQLANAAQNNCR